MATCQIQELRFTALPTWFPPTRDHRAHAKFYTVVQEDMYMAYDNSRAQFREQRVIDLEVLANIVGQDISPYLTFLPKPVGLLALPGTYVEDWVQEFYASVWVAPDHSYTHYALVGTDYRVIA